LIDLRRTQRAGKRRWPKQVRYFYELDEEMQALVWTDVRAALTPGCLHALPMAGASADGVAA